jgi:hypothetical protein
MLASPEDAADAISVLTRYAGAGVQAAMKHHSNPALVAFAAPTALAGLAGSYALQLVRSRVINDGEAQQLLAEMIRQLQAHADPTSNPPTGSEVSPTWGQRFRALIKSKRRG